MRARAAGVYVLVTVVASGLTLRPATAQEPEERVLVSGTVVDLVTGEPLEGAFVRPPEPHRGSLTDESGRFELSLPRGEDHALEVERLGYAPAEFVLSADEMAMTLRIQLDPQAILLEGIEVYSESLMEQFARRQNASAGLISTFTTEDLINAEVNDGFEFFNRVFRTGRPCTGRVGWCAVTPRGELFIGACIDGMPAWGGAEELRDYAPEEFYMIEVEPFGDFVRAYTWEWMRSGFRSAMLRMDPIVRVNENAPRAAAFTAFQEAFQDCA
jgi:hypothetical protein